MYVNIKANKLCLTTKQLVSQPIIDMQGKQAQLGHAKAVSGVLFGRINGEKMIPYKKKHILYNYNGLII